MTASNKSLGGALKWAYLMNWGERSASTLFTFALAAVLGPRDFGTVAMAMLYITFIQLLLDQGVVAALVQRRGLSKAHLDSTFWMNLVMCVTLAGTGVLMAPWWARINRLPELENIVIVLSASILIQGFAVVQRAHLQREMAFKQLSIRSNVSVVIGGAVGLACAVSGLGVWSLVIQRIVQDAAAVTFMWSVSRWRPSWSFSPRHVREIVRFSLASFIGRVGTFVNFEGDSLILGLYIGPLAVGYYRLAQRVSNVVIDVMAGSVQVVSLSEFSRYQDEPAKLRESIVKILRLSSAMTVPALASVLVIAPELLSVLGPQWLPATTALQYLLVLGSFQSVAYFTGPLMTATGRPLFMSSVIWVIALVNLCGLFLAGTYLVNQPAEAQVGGIAATKLLIGLSVMVPILVGLLLRYGGLAVGDLWESVRPGFVAALSVIVAALLLDYSGLLGGRSVPIQILAKVAVGAPIGSIALLALAPDVRARVRRVWPLRSVVIVRKASAGPLS